MAEAAAGEVIELHFGDKFVVERLPLHGMLCAPTAFASGSFSGEARRFDEFQEFFGQRGALLIADGRGETDVIEGSFLIVKAEEQGTDFAFLIEIPEPADNAIGSPLCLDLLHAGPFARLVRKIVTFGHDAV